MMDFETWLREYGPQAGYIDEVDFLACWQAAQAAERNRTKELVSTLRAVLAVSERRHSRDMTIITDCVKFALAKYQDADH